MNIGTNAAAPSGFQTVLSQVFPWKENDTILVTDSVACDGRFVMYAAASAALTPQGDAASQLASNQKEACVLWLGCTSIIESTILASLRKIGCDKSVLTSALLLDQRLMRSSSLCELIEREQEIPLLTVCSIPSVMEQHLEPDAGEFKAETLVKDIFQLVQSWRKTLQHTSKGPMWVIVDDVSTLASHVGKRLAYHFLLLLQSWKFREEACNFGLLVRCANDYDLELIGLIPASTPNYDWLDRVESDSDSQRLFRSPDIVPWERAIVEFADTIVDVTPLANGNSREVHGRLLFRVQSPEAASYTYNYCLTDSQVFVMRTTSQHYPGR
jgi:hypothetical protein